MHGFTCCYGNTNDTPAILEEAFFFFPFDAQGAIFRSSYFLHYSCLTLSLF